MRNVTSLAAATAFPAAMLLSAPSQAMTPGAASGVKGAAATLDPVEKTACWRYGWHGWGWYPCYYGGYYPYYGGYGYGYGHCPLGGHWWGGWGFFPRRHFRPKPQPHNLAGRPLTHTPRPSPLPSTH